MWWIIVIVPVLLLIYKAMKQKKLGPIDTGPENSLPDLPIKNNADLELVYLYMATWLLRKNAKDNQTKKHYLFEYFVEQFNTPVIKIEREFNHSMQQSTNIRSVSHWVLRHMKSTGERLKLMDFLIDLSTCENNIVDRESVAITRFGNLIGISTIYIHKAIEKRLLSIDLESNSVPKYWIPNSKTHIAIALKMLQLETVPVSEKELKRAFRKLANKYHPDKQVAVSDFVSDTSYFIQLKSAYEFLCNELKLK